MVHLLKKQHRLKIDVALTSEIDDEENENLDDDLNDLEFC